ncbi:MAG: DUF2497 domain-containing protein [Rhizobiaceae bacterium]|nr:DUF2497 domain-containing protein [Rhizobiaceae bacterium]
MPSSSGEASSGDVAQPAIAPPVVAPPAAAERFEALRPSLSEAYGASRLLAGQSEARVVAGAILDGASAEQAERLRAETGIEKAGAQGNVSPACLHSVAAVAEGEGAFDRGSADGVQETDEDSVPDFSLEFEEADFAAALLSEVEAQNVASAAALHEDEATSECVEVPSFAALAAPAPQLSSVIAETSSIMSAEAGAEVAAAFDDLARAIRDGQMKSMEEMAREMLRPMLQEWLDDNLPRLAEKLVREEIERVARGGRR